MLTGALHGNATGICFLPFRPPLLLSELPRDPSDHSGACRAGGSPQDVRRALGGRGVEHSLDAKVPAGRSKNNLH